MNTFYHLPEPPLDPPDDEETSANRRVKYEQALIEQAEEDMWYEKHGTFDL